MQKKIVIALLILSIVGIALSLYSFLHSQSLTSGEICNFDERFSCDIVNKGPYGKIANIPVSLLGIIGYGLILVAAGLKYRNLKDRGLTAFLLLGGMGGFAFSLYLTGIEAFILHAYCIICVVSALVMTAVFILALKLWYTEKKIYDREPNP